MNRESFFRSIVPFLRRKDSEGNQVSAEEKESQARILMAGMPLTNECILSNLISDLGLLTLTDIRQIADAYKTYHETFSTDEPPVSEILKIAGVKNPRMEQVCADSFYKKACFNYKRGIDAWERFVKDSEAQQELEAGKKHIVNWLDPRYMSVDRLIQYDLDKLVDDQCLGKHNQKQTEIAEIIDPNAATDGCVYYLPYTLNNMCVRYNSHIKVFYTDKIIPLLDLDQVVVPSILYKHPSGIKDLFGNHIGGNGLRPIKEDLKDII